MSAQPPPPDAGRLCPFCGAIAETAPCRSCGQDPSAPRRPCPACQRMTPSRAPRCIHCGKTFVSDLWWKVPLIVFLFFLALVLSVVLALAT